MTAASGRAGRVSRSAGRVVVQATERHRQLRVDRRPPGRREHRLVARSSSAAPASAASVPVAGQAQAPFGAERRPAVEGPDGRDGTGGVVQVRVGPRLLVGAQCGGARVGEDGAPAAQPRVAEPGQRGYVGFDGVMPRSRCHRQVGRRAGPRADPQAHRHGGRGRQRRHHYGDRGRGRRWRRRPSRRRRTHHPPADVAHRQRRVGTGQRAVAAAETTRGTTVTRPWPLPAGQAVGQVGHDDRAAPRRPVRRWAGAR